MWRVRCVSAPFPFCFTPAVFTQKVRPARLSPHGRRHAGRGSLAAGRHRQHVRRRLHGVQAALRRLGRGGVFSPRR